MFPHPNGAPWGYGPKSDPFKWGFLENVCFGIEKFHIGINLLHHKKVLSNVFSSFALYIHLKQTIMTLQEFIEKTKTDEALSAKVNAAIMER